MGSGGPGNIVHIDNLYVKPVAVADNTAILLGEFIIFDTTGYRPLVAGDFTGDDTFLDLQVDNVLQAGHDANNLTTTPVNDRVAKVTAITKGSDWTTKMAAGVEPDKPVGISRLDARTPVIAVADIAGAAAPVLVERLGVYKHKEFATDAEDSALNDDGVISTGVV